MKAKQLLNGRTRKTAAGFTLIEVLVVVLILSILMAIALPLYLNSVKDSAKKTCRANMQTIANAVQANRVTTRAANYLGYAGAVSVAKEPDLQAVPVCPDAGAYTIVTAGNLNDANGVATAIPAGGFGVSCSAATGHGGFIPGSMSN